MTTFREAATQVLNRLTEAGFESYFVGGCVRDTLLNLEPKDWDVTTVATKEQVLALFGENAKLVGAAFGVALVYSQGFDVEVATFRNDGSYSDGRRPDTVEFTSDVREDVQRRDFTVNALLMDAEGKVFDYVGGRADLDARVLRTVGDAEARFGEDALRMLRAVRFACKLDFVLSANVVKAMQLMAETVKNVSAERVAVELTGVLTSGSAERGVNYLSATGLLDVLLPEVAACAGVAQNPKHHPEGDVYEHTMKLLSDLGKNCAASLAWATLLHDVGKPATFALHPKTGLPTFYGHEDVGAVMAGEVMRRLKFSNDVADVVVDLVAQHMRFMNVTQMKTAKVKQFVRQPNFDQLLELHRLDTFASTGDYTAYDFVKNFLKETPHSELFPSKLLTGNDLVELGFKPGPAFKTVLSGVEFAQLGGSVSTREQAVKLATQLYKNCA